MNNLIGLITDSHFGVKNFNKQFWYSQIEFFEKQFFPYLIKHKIKDVIHLGDVVHNRNLIDLWLLQEIKNRFLSWFETNKINLHFILGNHDCYHRYGGDGYNFYNVNINEYNYVKYYDKPEVVTIGKYAVGMVPWSGHELTLLDNCDILCGHFEMADVPMNNKNQVSIDGLKSEIFSKYKLVFSGHYHARSQKQNIHYIGSPYQLTWGDFSEDKGFALLNDKFKVSYIENNVNPKFLKVYVIEKNNEIIITLTGDGDNRIITKEELLELNKNHYIKIITKGIENQSSFDIFYLQLTDESKNNHKIEIVDSDEIVESLNFEDIELELNEDKTTFDIISTYIEGIDFTETIDKDLIMKMFKELYSESQDLVI